MAVELVSRRSFWFNICLVMYRFGTSRKVICFIHSMDTNKELQHLLFSPQKGIISQQAVVIHKSWCGRVILMIFHALNKSVDLMNQVKKNDIAQFQAPLIPMPL